MEIKIRHAEPEDYRALQEVYAQPKAFRGTLQLPFPSVEMWRKRLVEKPKGLYMLVACVDNEIVGSLGLSIVSNSPRRRHVGELWMAVHDKWQGKGVGTSLMAVAVDLADQWLNIERLELTVYTDNEPAITLYKNFGFKIEGTHQNFAFCEGEYIDAHSMARIKSLLNQLEEDQ